METVAESNRGDKAHSTMWATGVDFRSPDDVDELVRPLVDGIRTDAIRRKGFRARIRACNLGGQTFLNFATNNGVASFDEGRSWGTVNVALFSSFLIGVGSKQFCVGDGEFHLLAPDVGGVLEPGNRSQLLGFSVDWDRLTKHLNAASGPGNEIDHVSFTPLNAGSAEGRHFLSYLDRFCRNLNQPGFCLTDARLARETVDTIECLLAQALCAALGPNPTQPDAISVQRAGEFLAESLDTVVNLSDAAVMAGTSTRSLLRAFRKAHGTSPMAFRRRRRFEAARHDLFLADPEETSVTTVANRYCFDHLGRFAVEYRTLFGESPSQTLRR